MKTRKTIRSKTLLAALLAAGPLESLHGAAIATESSSYYLSSSEGDDSRTRIEARHPSTPWRTIGKLNSSVEKLLPGDAILLKRGDVFYGALAINGAGEEGNPIAVGAYGNGAKPILSGFSSLAAWSSLGNNLHEATVPGDKTAINCVVIAGALQPIGRYPKVSDANGGYLIFEDHSGNGEITDKELNESPNWVGGEIVIRKNHWVIDRTRVISQVGNVLGFTPGFSRYALVNGSGYFIQNHPATLTQNGEWCYNSSRHRLTIHHAAKPPEIKVSTIDQLLTVVSSSNIRISDLQFEGANTKAVYADNVASISIENCDFRFSGTYAIQLNRMSGAVQVTGNVVADSLNNAIVISSRSRSPGSFCTIRHNVISNTGIIAGMGESGDGKYKALVVAAEAGAIIEYNTIKNAGYVPLEFSGNNILVKNNVIDNYCLVKDDGAGIYTWNGGNPVKIQFNRIVTGNIISNGIGNAYGTFDGKSSGPKARGIYMDNNVNHVEITDNTIYNIMGDYGSHNNSPSFITMTGNTFFNVGGCFDLVRWVNDGSDRVNGGQDITNLNIRNNLFFTTTVSQRGAYYFDRGMNVPEVASLQDRISSVGEINDNYYYLPNEAGFGYAYRNDKTSRYVRSGPLSFAGWRLVTGFEKNGRLIPNLPDYRVRKILSNNLFPAGQFTSDMAGVSIRAAGNNQATWDDTGRMTGPGALKVSFATPPFSPDEYVLLSAPIGAVRAATTYIIRFNAISTVEDGIVRVGFKEPGMPGRDLTPLRVMALNTFVRKHEVLLRNPVSSTNASWAIDVRQESGSVYIDDVEVYEVEATDLALADRVRLEVNPTNAVKRVLLTSDYVDVQGAHHRGSISLPPFSSKVLIAEGP